MTNKKSQETFNEESFERDVYNSLKYYGFLFPENSREVEHFEELYGDTEIETPSSNELFNKNKNDKSLFPGGSFDINLSMAAYKSEADFIIDIDEAKPKEKDSLNSEVDDRIG